MVEERFSTPPPPSLRPQTYQTCVKSLCAPPLGGVYTSCSENSQSGKPAVRSGVVTGEECSSLVQPGVAKTLCGRRQNRHDQLSHQDFTLQDPEVRLPGGALFPRTSPSQVRFSLESKNFKFLDLSMKTAVLRTLPSPKEGRFLGHVARVQRVTNMEGDSYLRQTYPPTENP